MAMCNLRLKSSISDDFDDVVERDPSGRYVRYNEILGKGAFKTVYKAFDEVDGIEVAWNRVDIDEVLESPQQLERLYSEINLLTRKLKHLNIIRCYHSWVDDDSKTVNMITELFTSGNLRLYRKKHKYVDLKAIKNWARQILKGLQYLHSQKPCVIHRDLKCDNIFVNGNTGEVKIGDLGLATVMQQPTARSVIGTPEFMAPELYEEEYNELVDIYSFGMCMLEMVTCEYPYSECINPCQIFRKVTLGIKPAGLSRVTDPHMKEFIDRCLLPASERPSAEELLKDPFLSSSTPTVRSPLPLMPNMSEPVETHSMDVDLVSRKNDPCSNMSSGSDGPQSFVWKLECSNDVKTFNLEGQAVANHKIKMFLVITSVDDKPKLISFDYDPQDDTALSIAKEMSEELRVLSKEDVVLIQQLMEQLLAKILPHYSPPDFNLAGVEGLSEESSASHSSQWKSGMLDVSSGGIGRKDHGTQESLASGISVEYSLMNHPQDPGSSVNDRCNAMFNESSLSSSISSLALMEKDNYYEELKQELDAIDSQYNQRFRELSRRREEAIECAKRKWSTRKVPVA